MRRIIMAATAVSALAIPASAALVATSSPAFASSSLSCSKLTGNISSTVAISKCSPLTKSEKKAYASASGQTTTLETGGTITWSNSGATTVLSSPSLSSGGSGTCKKGETQETATGTVTGGTAAVTKSGDTYSADVCYDSSNGDITLAKGTDAEL